MSFMLSNCAYKDFKKAQKYEEMNEYLKAAQSYKKVITMSASNKKAYLGLSDSLYANAIKKSVFDIYQEKDWNNALKTLEIAVNIEDENLIKRKENFYNSLKVIATICLKESKHKAEQYLSKALELKKDDPDIYFSLAYLNGEKNKTEDEIANYKKSLELNRTFSEANINLGIIYKKIGMLDEAEKYFKAAAGSDTVNFLPEFGLADVYLLKKKYDEADKILKSVKIENLKDNNNLKSDYFNKIGIVKMQTKKLDEALDDFKQSIKYNFWNPKTRVNAGIAYFYKEDFKNALSEFNSAVELESDNSDIYNSIGLCYMRLKNYDKAVQNFNKAASVNQNNADAYRNLYYFYETVMNDKTNADYYKLKFESLNTEH